MYGVDLAQRNVYYSTCENVRLVTITRMNLSASVTCVSLEFSFFLHSSSFLFLSLTTDKGTHDLSFESNLHILDNLLNLNEFHSRCTCDRRIVNKKANLFNILPWQTDEISLKKTLQLEHPPPPSKKELNKKQTAKREGEERREGKRNNPFDMTLMLITAMIWISFYSTVIACIVYR